MGSSKDSYTILYAYGETRKIENLGIVFNIELEDTVHFKYMLMTLGRCMKVYVNYCPLIIVDGSNTKKESL